MFRQVKTLTLIVRYGLIAVALVAIDSSAHAQAPWPSQDLAKGNCKLIAQADWRNIPGAPTAIDRSVSVEAKDGNPAYCEVVGYVSPANHFMLRMPANWNGNYGFAPCAGVCGNLGINPNSPEVRRGYAWATTDGGHQGGNTAPGVELFMIGNDHAPGDYGSKAVHDSILATKYIATKFYGQAPKYSIAVGQSKGGAGAVMEVAKYPDSFDGVIAIDPPLNINQLLAIREVYDTSVLYDADGKRNISTEEINTLHAAVLGACDAIDNHKDGIIDDPWKCHFDPMTIECPKASPCLSHKGAVAAKAAYDGPHDSKGKLLHPGFLPGSEIGWEGWVLPRSSSTINPNFGNEYYGVEAALAAAGRQFLRPPDPASTNWHAFKADGLMARVMPLDKDMNVFNPANVENLAKYKARGGKIIIAQSLYDEAVSPTLLRDLMDNLAKRYGGSAEVNKFMRVFFAPGAQHVAPKGTAGSALFDRVAVLEDWVLNGKAPDAIEVTGGAVQPRRVLHPYPAPPDPPTGQTAVR